MGLLITLRTESKESNFKELMFGLFKAFDVDELLICSGYFQELKPYDDAKGVKQISSFQVTTDKSSDGDYMQDTFKCVDKVTLVGFKNDKKRYWEESYKNFIDALKNAIGKAKVTAYKDNNDRWHAKVIIMRSKKRSVAGIIGSSNLTKPAYGSDPSQEFNIEADVFIYNKAGDSKISDYARTKIAEGELSDVIFATYDPEANNGKSETDILDEHYERIMDTLRIPGEFTEID